MAKSPTKYSKFLSPFKNVFIVILIIFCIWMLFFDTHNLFLHRELNKEINKLEQEKEYYKKEIDKDKKELKSLSNDEGVEKYGRERYKMKKENEEIYLIEYEDSIKKSKK
ncbi:MAG: septum formation initiator [Flavobacteriaceae bacterium]|nr:septum formation initiator family protein [Bacteroidia bacterium]NNK82211.1 septum formation initiator [Flavobacteriaceae bacterium]